MLRGIPPIISPELMKILMEMGHGDEIVLADGNFPATANAQRLVRCDGHSIPNLLQAIIPFFPLDKSADCPAVLMSLLPGDESPAVWEQYRFLIREYEPGLEEFGYEERFAFYTRTRNAFAVVATSDQSFKGNLILKKGVIRA